MATATKRIKRTRLAGSQKTPRDLLKEKLTPLKWGNVVKMVVETTRVHGSMRRADKTLLIITPGGLLGLTSEAVVIMLVGKGCRVVFPKTGKGAGELARAGLPPKLAKALIEKLTETYGEK